MGQFVGDPQEAVAAGERAGLLFPRMIELAREAEVPVDDLEHMREFFGLILLARRYYFLPFDEALVAQIREAKVSYKLNWPKESRQRYRIKVSFDPFPLKRRTVSFAARLLLRRKRGYRWVDRVFTLYLAGFAYRLLRPRDPEKMPKFLRKSAMGVDTLFK